MPNELRQVYGTQVTVITRTTSITAAGNTVAADATQLNNSLNYPSAVAVLNIPDGFAAAPTAGQTLDLFMVLDDIDGTADETPEPAAGDIEQLARYVGSFVMDNQAVAVRKPIVISLEGVRLARYFLKNSTGQTAQRTTADITVKITPFSVEPTP